MNTRLQELFNLPQIESESQVVLPDTQQSPAPELAELDAQTLDKVDQALPVITDLAHTDQELDALAQLAEKGYRDLMDLGMNVEVRHAGEIFGVAGNLLGHSLNARRTKIDKKLKIIDLQIRKMRLDQHKTPDADASSGSLPPAMVLDRNALIQDILNKARLEEKTTQTDK